MDAERILREEVRSWLGRTALPSTAEGLLDVVTKSLEAAEASERLRMIQALFGFVAAISDSAREATPGQTKE